MSAGVAARAAGGFGGFCEKPWEWPWNRAKPNPANAIPAIRRPRTAASIAEVTGRRRSFCGHVTLNSPKLDGDPVGVAETQEISTRGRQHCDVDRAQFARDGLAVECRHADPEAIDVRLLARRDLLQPQPCARGGEPDALLGPVPGGLLAKKLAIE